MNAEQLLEIKDKRTVAYKEAKKELIKNFKDCGEALQGETFSEYLYMGSFKDIVNGGMFNTYYEEATFIDFDTENFIIGKKSTFNGANRALCISDAYETNKEDINEEYLNSLNYKDFIATAEILEEAIEKAYSLIANQKSKLNTIAGIAN